MTLVCAKAYLQARNLFRVDLFALILLSLFGQCVMISSGHLLTIYLGLELSALASYAMIALQRDSSITSEAAIKIFHSQCFGFRGFYCMVYLCSMVPLDR